MWQEAKEEVTMSLTLLDGGTTSTAGGAAQAFSRSSTPVTNGYEYADVAEADYFARQKLVVTSRMPSLQSDGSYSKQKSSARFILPITLADGSIAYNVARVEIECHPEATAANLAELREYAGQLAMDSELDTLYTAGTFPA
jgi:hypothetical protein